MTERTPISDDQYAHLRAHAATQRQMTVERLKQAIATLEAAGRPVTTFSIKEVSQLDYMAYYRNAEALALFRAHSTHLREERAKEEVKRRGPGRKFAKQDNTLHQVKVKPRDPLLAYKKPDLVVKLRTAYAERDQFKQQVLADRAELEQRYTMLLQTHMQCGVTIAKLEAEVAEFRVFMQRFRMALSNEEHGTQQ